MVFEFSTLIVPVIVLLAIAVIFMGVKTIPQASEFTVERFGKYTKTLEPGLNFIIPFGT